MDTYQYGYEDITFHDGQTATANGTVMNVKGHRCLTLEVSCLTATATRTVSFRGVSFSGELVPVAGVNMETITTATSTSAQNTLFQIDVTGLHQFYAPITAINGDTVTVKGRAVT